MIDIFFNLWESLFSAFATNSIGLLCLGFCGLGLGFSMFRLFERAAR